MKGKVFNYYLIVMLLTISCHKEAEPEIYLVPENYMGKVNILFEKKAGRPKKFEGHWRVYEIPQDGILQTQFKYTSGFVKRRYFAVARNGVRTPLPVFELGHEKDGTVRWNIKRNDLKGIFMDGVNGQYGNDGSDDAVFYEEFIVADYRHLDSVNSPGNLKSFENKVLRYNQSKKKQN